MVVESGTTTLGCMGVKFRPVLKNVNKACGPFLPIVLN